jgi:Primosomal protein N'' (replication factor Y) - superfamily II helicase
LLSLGFSKRSIKSLLDKGILIPVESSIKIKTPVFKQPKTSDYTPKLLESQIYVYDRFYFKDRLKAYISLIKKYVKTNKSVLIVVPSIAFGNILYKDLSQKFENVYFYHDGINPKFQFEIFKEITKNSSIVIGTVSSLLIPIKDLNLIILEQEHSSAYKVLRSPRFETKRVLYYIHKEKYSNHLSIFYFIHRKLLD